MKGRRISEMGYVAEQAKDLRSRIFVAVKETHPDQGLAIISVEGDGHTHLRTDLASEDLLYYLKYLIGVLEFAIAADEGNSDPNKTVN